MHADIIQENNLANKKQPKHSEWTQWDEAKSGRQNLWAAQMTVWQTDRQTNTYLSTAYAALCLASHRKKIRIAYASLRSHSAFESTLNSSIISHNVSDKSCLQVCHIDNCSSALNAAATSISVKLRGELSLKTRRNVLLTIHTCVLCPSVASESQAPSPRDDDV